MAYNVSPKNQKDFRTRNHSRRVLVSNTADWIELAAWIKKTDAKGGYACGNVICPERKIRVAYYFSDDNTAFEFKMRFG